LYLLPDCLAWEDKITSTGLESLASNFTLTFSIHSVSTLLGGLKLARNWPVKFLDSYFLVKVHFVQFRRTISFLDCFLLSETGRINLWVKGSDSFLYPLIFFAELRISTKKLEYPKIGLFVS